MANEKNYASLNTLRTFLEKLATKFAELAHKHTLKDIEDYKVDSELSSQSENPVQNKVIDAEFSAISEAMTIFEKAIDDKADANHNHDESYYTKSEIDSLELITVTDIDTICGSTIQSAEDVMF